MENIPMRFNYAISQFNNNNNNSLGSRRQRTSILHKTRLDEHIIKHSSVVSALEPDDLAAIKNIYIIQIHIIYFYFHNIIILYRRLSLKI